MSAVLKNLGQHWWSLIDERGREIPLTDVNQVNVFGESPIHIAAWKGRAEDVRWLLENGAHVNQKGEFGMTPLHYAYMGGKKQNIEFLLHSGADQNSRCESGLLPHEGCPAQSEQRRGW